MSNTLNKKSVEAAARYSSIDPTRVREWRKNKVELQLLSQEDNKRARLRGAGKKKASNEIELKNVRVDQQHAGTASQSFMIDDQSEG